MCKRAACYGHVNLGHEMGGTTWGKNRGKGNGVWPRHVPALTSRTLGIQISCGYKDQLTWQLSRPVLMGKASKWCILGVFWK